MLKWANGMQDRVFFSGGRMKLLVQNEGLIATIQNGNNMLIWSDEDEWKRVESKKVIWSFILLNCCDDIFLKNDLFFLFFFLCDSFQQAFSTLYKKKIKFEC